nr:two-component regulator propeller domain-containing protein [Bacteroides acidifaciens]
MHNAYFLLLSCLLLQFSTVSNAQTYPYTLQHLDVEDGLSNNYVTDITQDKRGCLWVATEGGVSRFDGKRFKVFNASNSGITGNSLNALHYDGVTDKLWIGAKNGLSLLDCATQQFEPLTFPDSIRLYNIAEIKQASDSSLWIVNHYENIVHHNYHNGQNTIYSPRNIPGLPNSFHTVLDDGKGNLFIGHAQEGMSIVNLKTNSVKNYRHDANNSKALPGNSVYCIHIDHYENIWVATNQGLALFNPMTEEFVAFRHISDDPHSLVADHVYAIKEIDGILWIGCDTGGVSLLDLRSLTFMNPDRLQFRNITVTYDSHGISSGNIRSLFHDSFGNVWIGNYSTGLDFISRRQPAFQLLPYNIDHGPVIKHKSVWSIYTDSKQQIWIGSENELALFKDNRLKKIINIAPYLTRSYAQVCAIIEEDNCLLLGMFDDGLLRLNTMTNQVDRIHLERDNTDVNSFYKDENGKIWIGTEYGLYSYNKGEARNEEEINRQIDNLSVYGIQTDKQGKLWVGTFGNGVHIFDKEKKKIAQLIDRQGFCSNAVSQLYVDSHDGMWVATRNGIGYIKDTGHLDQFETYQYDQGLEDTFVRALQEDRAGNIWLSTNNGISRWNKQTRRFENYDFHNGIPQGNFMDRAADIIISDDLLYFGSLNGVCYFHPQEVIGEDKITSLHIIECKGLSTQIESRKGEVLLPATDMIELPYNRNSFRVSFSVPDYSQSGLVEYAYLIEGLEDNWTNTLGENQVTFRNISPGEYTFKVKARLRNQEWDDDHIASLKVCIHPPLWLTWYAKTLYVLFVFGSVFIWLRFYKHKVLLESSLELEKKKSQNEQELNNERLRFYTNITHELRTPLTLILGPLEDLINDTNLPAFYAGKIKIIHDSAFRLLNLINQILEFRKTETQNRKLTVAKGDLGSLVTEIGLRYKELNRNVKVQFHIRIETEQTRLYFDSDVITTILNNLLSNALKYTPEGEINLILRSIHSDDNLYTEIVVSDTGYGIETQVLPHIFDRYYQAEGKHQASGTGIGLALVKSLADLHEGLLNVESEVGKGTIFVFRLLTENTYPDALHKEEKTETGIMEDTEYIEEKTDADIRPMILVVEDNDDIREYISASFSANFRILSAANGKEGWEQAQTSIPDIIISDIMMPVMDGIELCKKIKEDVCTSHIPVILLTAKDSIQNKEEGYESGADSYLTKPFSARLLNSRVRNLLDSRKKLAALIASRAKELKPENELEPIGLNKLDADFLSRFTSIVEDNLSMDELDMSFMKDKMRMSHSTLYRKIKGLTGMSGNEFIRKVRLKNSLRLLMEEGNNISEAAYASGFNDLGYFRTCFKEEYGMTPSEYIKQQR